MLYVEVFFQRWRILVNTDNGEGNEGLESRKALVELVGVQNIAFAETRGSYCKSILEI